MAIRVPSLSRQTIARTLDKLSPLLLVPLMSNFSHAVSSSVLSSRALASALQAAGIQRLHNLQSATPRVRAVLDKLASRLPNVRLNVEEIAIVRAVIEFYIGLVLQLLMANDRPRRTRRTPPPSFRRRDVLTHLLFLPVRHAHRTRIGVFLPPSLIAR
jgi:hypothetical protein